MPAPRLAGEAVGLHGLLELARLSSGAPVPLAQPAIVPEKRLTAHVHLDRTAVGRRPHLVEGLEKVGKTVNRVPVAHRRLDDFLGELEPHPLPLEAAPDDPGQDAVRLSPQLLAQLPVDLVTFDSVIERHDPDTVPDGLVLG